MAQKRGCPKTVGELRAFIAELPDDMPLHHRGNMGEHPPGLMLMIRHLASAKSDPTYFADIETDEIWSRPDRRKGFGKSVLSLCVI